PQDTSKSLQLVLTTNREQGHGTNGQVWASFQIFSRDSAEVEADWTLHASGDLRVDESTGQQAPDNPAAACAGYGQTQSAAECYRLFAGRGFDFGPEFQAIEQLWHDAGKAMSRIRISQAVAAELGDYRLHPVLLDACFQTAASLLPEHEATFLPVRVERLWVSQAPHQAAQEGGHLWAQAHIRDSHHPDSTVLVDAGLYDAQGAQLALVEGLCFRTTPRAALTHLRGPSAETACEDWLYEIAWQPVPRGHAVADSSERTGDWLIL